MMSAAEGNREEQRKEHLNNIMFAAEENNISGAAQCVPEESNRDGKLHYRISADVTNTLI